MHGLQVWNDQAMIRVSRAGRLAFGRMPDGKLHEGVELQEGSVEVDGSEPLRGLLFYAIPCISERLVVRLEGVAAPVLNRVAGEWPAAVDDDQLETYPNLHFLEERKTGMPWRFERWYTVAGKYVIYDSEQYFERTSPVDRGKNWERLIVQLRQVIDVPARVERPDAVTEGLLSGDDS